MTPQLYQPSPATNMNSALDQARNLRLPSTEETLRRDGSVYQFWDDNEELLTQAWAEWNAKEAGDLPKLDATLINPKLRAAVEAAWKNPTRESEARIKDLWEEVAPGVWAIQFFDLAQLHRLRQWFDTTARAGVPTRPPYGIVLNRKGVMTDPQSVGHLAAPDFQAFYRLLVDEYIRPVSRAFFPDDIVDETDDNQSFSFSIQYQGVQGGDKSIRPHSDASTVTFNLNLDPAQSWTGSSLIFFTDAGKQQVQWAPGIAVMHLGKIMHAALPIESGTRSNWVVWTKGSRMPYQAYGAFAMGAGADGAEGMDGQMSVAQRWTKPKPIDRKLTWQDRWSPF